MNDPVAIAAFRADGEAEAAREALAEAGVSAAVVPRGHSYPRLYEDVLEAGFDLLVDRGDADAALVLVDELWLDQPGAARPIAQCPACGSPSIARLARLRLFVAVGALLFVAGEVAGQRQIFLLAIGIFAALLLLARPLHCRECGERWRAREGPPPDHPVEGPAEVCPQCGSEETEAIPRRRERAWTLLVNYILPPLILVWPSRPSRRCVLCGHEWR